MKLSLVLRTKNNTLKLSTMVLERFVERIKTDTKDAAVGRRRHQLTHDKNIAAYDRQYPSRLVYPSAVFEKDDNGNLRMQTFNGVVALTVDGLDKRETDVVKHAAQILHYTLAAFVGPSGHEVIILVKVAGDPCLTEEDADVRCQEGHRLASAIYQGIIAKPITMAPVSVKSCFYMPLDEMPYCNPRAIALPVSGRPLPVSQPLGSPVMLATDTVSDVLDAEGSDVSRQARQLMDFLNANYKFRYNTIMGYTEYLDNNLHYMEWAPLDMRTLKGMTMKVRLHGIDARDNDVRRYVQSDMISLYDPVNDYLWEQYGKWDGKDYIRKLARTVPTNNPYWEDWFYTWFLGMVKQWQVSNLAKYGNQAVPLLISGQGWNKSTFCEQLLPPELSFGYTGNLQMEDKKQVLQQMAQMLLINLDEFNQISPRTQQGFLKNVITLSSVKIKRPYGHHVEDFPRRASFIATTNQADVLADPSGSRRFLSVELTGPIDVSTPLNYEQLYAQAMEALHQHEPHYFSPAETQYIMEWNKKFSLKTVSEQSFFDYFDIANDESEGQWMSASTIFAYLKEKVGASMLRQTNIVTFGRRLSNIPELKKRVTNSNSLYLVKRK